MSVLTPEILDRAVEHKEQNGHIKYCLYSTGRTLDINETVDLALEAEKKKTNLLRCCILGATVMAVREAGIPLTEDSWRDLTKELSFITGDDPCNFNNHHDKEDSVNYLRKARETAVELISQM